jgi:methylated-DNA-[protein]-cysteine S-methyltransferase
MMYIEYLKTPAGVLKITADDDFILSIGFADRAGRANPNALAQKCAAQLSEYFEGKRTRFDLPLKTEGTPFRRAVWNALADIPYGETRSYEDIARAVGSPRGVRAVGGANACNRFTIVIPCHRVIRKDGTIGGYGGGVARKKFLLKLEARTASSVQTGGE